MIYKNYSYIKDSYHLWKECYKFILILIIEWTYILPDIFTFKTN